MPPPAPPTHSPVIPSTTLAAPFLPKSPAPVSPLHLSPTPSPHETIAVSRRRAAFLLSILTVPPLLLSVHDPPTASAFSLGISGPKNWLKEQKKKSSKFLLAPVDASRNILRSAYLLMTKGETDYEENDLEEVKKLVTSATRDCVAEQRNSFVAFQAKTGVEVCTFRLIVNNASSLLDDKDPTKLEAESKLTDLIRSFTSLSDMTNEIGGQAASNRQRVANALMDALYSLDNFEQGIKDCLEI
ncbi:unnamed protein product [Coffea canephora]|uniref:Uncharacterized protein n=1 Tax=Coffea canephora TaxID=49390 RepID=A0A068UH26_COFCA|nr:unnamed protein product [Coffea canephora]